MATKQCLTPERVDSAECPAQTIANQFQPFDLADPFPFYVRARAEAPIFYSAKLDYWIVTRYEEVKAIFRDHQTFSAEITQQPYKPRPAAVLKVLEEGGFSGGSGLSGRIPPDHTRLRQFINKAFTPRRLQALEPKIRDLVNQHLESFIGNGRADLVAQLAYELPAQVIFLLLGIPDEDIPKVKRWAQSRVYLNFGDLPEAEQLEHAHNLVQYWQYCVQLVESRFETPTDDLPGDLVRIYQTGDQSITKHEIASLCYGQLTAGHETTTNLLGNGLKELLAQPGQWQALCHDPALLPNAVEEMLRYGPSVFAWRRLVKQPAQIGNIQFNPGDKILLILGSASRDSSHFAEGETMDVTRHNAKDHLAFGYGIHYCLGAPLARLQARLVLEELTTRLPLLRLCPNQTFEFAPNTTFRGPRHVWVEWDAVRRSQP